MNNYNFTQSLDGLNNIEADTVNTSNLNVGSLIVDTAKITTLSDCNLVNCTSDTPINTTSVVNKTYVDNNFVDKTTAQSVAGLKTFSVFPQTIATTPTLANELIRKDYVDNNFVYKTGSVAENITGLKTFTNNIEVFNATSPSLIISTTTAANTRSIIKLTGTVLSINNQNPFSSMTFQINSSTCLTINNSQVLLPASIFLTTNDIKSRAPTTAHSLLSDITTGTLTISSSTASNTINGTTTFPNNITSSGTLTASIIECGNYRGPSSTLDVFFGTTTTSGQVRLATALNTLGTLLIGSSVGNNTINGLTTFTNNTTFNTNAIFNSYIQLFSGPNNSYIQQSVADLVITNLFPAGSIYLKTRSLIAGTEDSLKINTISCDIFSPTLNLTSAGTISILSPNNLTGTINLFNTLTTGSVNISSSTSTTNLNGSVITNGQLTCNNICPISNTNATLTNHLTTLGFNNGKYVDFTTTQTITGEKVFTTIWGTTYNFTNATSNRVIVGVVGTSLQFVPATNSNIYRFYVKNDVGNDLVSIYSDYANTIIGNQATFNNFTPISSIATPTAVNHLTRKDYVDNNFLDRTNNLTQNINGLKTFTDDLTTLNIYCNNAVYFRDINLSLKRALIFNQSDVVYFDTSTVYDNYWKFKCFNIEQVVISQLSVTFNNKLISLAQARFDNFTPTCTVATPTQINHLTRKDYVDNNFVDKTTAQTGIAGDKTFTGVITISNNLVSNNLTASVLSGTQNIYTTLTSGSIVNIASTSAITNLNSSTINLNSSSTINILTPNNLTGVINFLSSLTTATINFCSTTYTSVFNLNARLAHKQVQYMNEVKTISGTSIALVFPLEQTWMFSATGATQITVTLPELTASYQAGFNFIIFKTASNTNSVLFTRSGTNTIRGLNSITDVTSVTRLSGTNSVGVGFYTAEVSAGNFAWISY